MPVSPPPGLEVRLAQATDLVSIVDLLISAPDDATVLTRLAVLAGTEVVGFSSWVRRAPSPDDPGSLQHRAAMSEPPLKLDAEEEAEKQDDGVGGVLQLIEPDKARADAIARVRGRLSRTSPVRFYPRYSLQGLAVHASHQGRGIGTLLVRRGLEQGTAEGVPVLTAGEARGMRFYTNEALGFHIVQGTGWWLDRDGKDIPEQEVKEGGNRGWGSSRSEVSGAQVVWLPPGRRMEIGGVFYRG
ncbi:acyl-CoA N-acyltransferase [Apiospora phragmitis]|uniref:Acyl-CoA N-acyltransferase n=1 Tax=Apiospora phragmitis TaxID=2905665 RepID=A0ABR1UUA0_9PEZI